VAGISFSGLASGIDTASMIDALMAIERQPRNRLLLEQSAANAREQALKDIQSRLKTLRTATEDLGSALLWTPKQSISSTDETKVSATMTGGAAPGGYNLKVTALATAAQQTLSWTDQAGPTTLTINGKAIELEAGATLKDAVAAINSDSDTGVFAVDVEGKLVLTSRTTGASATITATGDAIALESDVQGQNARYSINGGPEQESESNVVTGAIPGVTLTLKAHTDGTAINVTTPGVDKEAVRDKLKAFVSAYNDVVELITAKTSEKKVVKADGSPLTQSEAAQGVLFGDTGLRSILSTMRIAISDVIPGLTGDYATLASIGITTGATTGGGTTSADAIKGKLTLDESKLMAALEDDPLAVQKLLGGVSGTAGFSQKFAGGVLSPLVGVDGTFDQRLQSTTAQQNRIKDSLARMDQRLELREERLRAQFTAMELALQRSQAQAVDLSSLVLRSSSGS
jgi:flagellar hook-associated protein 2